MRSRAAVVVLLLTLPGLLATLPGGPAAARPGHGHHRSDSARLSLASSATAVTDGATVTLTGRSNGAVRGAVTLMEAAGGSWVRVARVRTSSRAYILSVTPAVGTHTYRASRRTPAGRAVSSAPVAVTVLPQAAVSPELAAARARILADTNAYRAQAGLPALVETAGVDAVAQQWTEQMASTGTFEHNPGYAAQMPAGWSRAGENIAYGYLPESVGAGWYASPGHRANMLGDFTTIGIGYAEDADGRGYYTQDFGKY